jgi:hypothetical protein
MDFAFFLPLFIFLRQILSFLMMAQTGVSGINLAPSPEASIGGPFGKSHT